MRERERVRGEGVCAITAKTEIERFRGSKTERAETERDGRRRKMTTVLSSPSSACRAPLQANVASAIK